MIRRWYRRLPAGAPGAAAFVAAIVVLIAVDVVAAQGTRAADLSGTGLHTLSPRSATAARALHADLVVTGFYRPAEQATRRDAQGLLQLYQQQSPRVKVRFLDPSRNVAQALKLGATVSGSLVLQYGSRTPVVLDQVRQTEADVTAAILRLESASSPMVCWAAGDGERSLHDAQDVSGYSAAADLLRTSEYRSQAVLVANQGVPAECDVLVVLQLGRPLTPASVRDIDDYLDGGGKLLIAIDPWLNPSVVASANSVVQQFGVGFDGGLVVEPDPAHAASGDPTIPVVSSYGSSPITADLDGREVFLPQATPITGSATGGATSVDLATTTGAAYVVSRQRTSLDRQPADRSGPFVLLRSVEEPVPGGTARIVLAGTSALAENRTMPPAASDANPDLLVASLDWLTRQDSLLAVAPRPPGPQPLVLSDRQRRLNALLTAVLLPLLVAGAGVLVARHRTHR